ncbi:MULTISPECIES: hypothetical protein [Streptomyces]|uniref:Secreted protein n=1 Tax=Streptomyces cadmiisoli TaxID=2184053 RepID=A0A2Z4J3Z7_9ACTN|nr:MULTISPECIES: hypothetical protein [Streptomyces]AWW39468.1 hypothetical protein DN051_24745 [Streptomyces cadmiisoli]
MDRGAKGIRRRLALGMALLTASGLFALAAPADAHAAAGCSGRKVRTLPFSTGTLHVYRQGRYVCAVTLAENPGRERTMSASVQARGHRPVARKGKRTHRIGTPLVYAGHRCVRVAGEVGGGSTSSGWILC